MPEPGPYVGAKPGELIKSENWNKMQVYIKKDIGQVHTEVEQARGGYDSLTERFENNPGPKGDRGDTGPPPAHEWDGTQLRFQNPDGT